MNVREYEFPLAPMHFAATRLTLYLCPSDRDGYGTNFRFCTGASHLDVDWERSPPYSTRRDAGAFAWREVGIRNSDIVDGLSNTAAASEKLRGSGSQATFDRTRDVWISGFGDLTGRYPTIEEAIAVCSSLSGPPAEFFAYNGWSFGADGHWLSLYNHLLSPNSKIPDCTMGTNRSIGFGQGNSRANGWHAGVVNVLLLDGAVRSVSDNVDLGLWRGLATRNGGDSVLSE
jgi:hypothetical protein